MPPAGPCPACAAQRAGMHIEERRDPIGGVLYRLYRCADCGISFSEPRDPVGPDWYEKEAPLRAQERRSSPEKDWRFRRFLAAGLTPGKILDVGCGDGGFLELAQSRGWTGVGVDYEERMIALARAKSVDAHAQDFASFLKTRAAGEFDAAVLFDVLEHAPEPRKLLAALKPALKRGAHLAITFPNDARPIWFGREDYDYPPHHFTRWTAPALAGFLRREGFSVVAVQTVGPSAWRFSEMLYYGLIARAALAAARLVLFGPGARGTVTGLYSAGSSSSSAPAPASGLKGLLADPARRRRAADLFKYACRVVTYPVGAVLALGCRLRADSGEHLYGLARYDA
jgi:SAM-dependent methyltransferase